MFVVGNVWYINCLSSGHPSCPTVECNNWQITRWAAAMATPWTQPRKNNFLRSLLLPPWCSWPAAKFLPEIKWKFTPDLESDSLWLRGKLMTVRKQFSLLGSFKTHTLIFTFSCQHLIWDWWGSAVWLLIQDIIFWERSCEEKYRNRRNNECLLWISLMISYFQSSS